MIKVPKKANKTIMEIFHREVILLIFKWLNIYSTPVYSITEFNRNTNFTQNEIRVLKIIFRKRTLKEHLNKILIFFLEKQSLKSAELKKLKKIYLHQRRQLKKGNYNLTAIKIDPIVSELFKKFFFKDLFENKQFWKEFISIDFSKAIFKKNFKIQVCPYCNTEEMFQIENYKIDHFLPKSMFPLLSMYYLNLIPICESCNSQGAGKGDKRILPIKSQFFEEIGENIAFFHGLTNNSINLKSNIVEINNFIKLLKLKDKYKSERIFEYLNKDLKSFEVDLSKSNSEEYEDFYLRKIKNLEGRSLYYAKKYLFKECMEIKKK